MNNKIDFLICPNCTKELNIFNKSLICLNNHCFDISKQGYINLLLPNKKKTKMPGDDIMMVNARNSFLQKGYYEELKNQITNIILKYKHEVILDAGCGTGYYTSGLDNKSNIIGIDISKNAIQTASKNYKEGLYIVSSIFEMPLKDRCIDIVLNIFAPKPQEEFKRVLKTDGIIIEVVPGKYHLKELKEVIYKEDFTLNKEKFAFTKFNNIESVKVSYVKHISSKEDIINLIKMTPYWYKGGAKNLINLDNIKLNKITLDFIINVWR